nr:tetraacyldisaccharide 4'-kinase [Aureimonas frigidaquae]
MAALLAPAARLYGSIAARRMARGPRLALDVPVLCVGNFTVGGGGKTPTALALAAAARAAGLSPGFLSRGYGGAEAGPILVDPAQHGAHSVGDEPLLLAAQARTVVAKDRAAGAKYLQDSVGVDFIIMDDGFQSARVHADFSLIAIDAGRGLGNGRVVPAGPLRAPLAEQIRHADALLVIGRGQGGQAAIRMTARGGKPVFEARLEPAANDLAGRRLLAFAGIADPDKFYRSLGQIGATPVRRRDFPDHHPLSSDEITELLADARRDGLELVTTRKDAVRLSGEPAAAELLAETHVLDVALVFEPEALAARFIAETRTAFRRRKFG